MNISTSVKIEHIKADLSELIPELTSWPTELRNVHPLPEAIIAMVVVLRDEAQRSDAELAVLGANTSSEEIEVHATIVRNIELAYDVLKMAVFAELDRGVFLQ